MVVCTLAQTDLIFMALVDVQRNRQNSTYGGRSAPATQAVTCVIHILTVVFVFVCLFYTHPNCAGVSVEFDFSTYTISESTNGTLMFRTSNSFSFNFTVTINTTNITATAGEDYAPGGYTVAFQSGQSTPTLAVPTFEDSIFETDKMYTATIVATSDDSRVTIGFSSEATVTIQDNDSKYLSSKRPV